MNEINRFVFHVKEFGFFLLPHDVQTIVTQDDEGLYHIHTRTIYKDGSGSKDFQRDIHGTMDKDAYIAWLSNALFNASHSQAEGENKTWLNSFEPEQLEDSS
jgi:hypothetical protein